mgnify:FL=1
MTVKLLLLLFSCGVKPSVSDLQGELKHIRLTVLGLRLLRQEIRKSNVLHFVLSVCWSCQRRLQKSVVYRTSIGRRSLC